VCCARFAPAGIPGAAAAAGAELALGSADHAVRVFDLRAAGVGRGLLATLTGHAQAVSYVRYAPGAPGLVSASTDATLRLWSRAWSGEEGAGAQTGAAPHQRSPPQRCVRVFRGHANERNFVGLDAAGDLVAAGSETGEVVVYAAALSRPVARAVCDDGRGQGGPGRAAAPAPGGGGLPAPPAFVSAVCWRPAPGDDSGGPVDLPRTLLAATSRGSVHVLELGGVKREG
jgi:E3 ubiquitin-protein ligase RFWD2